MRGRLTALLGIVALAGALGGCVVQPDESDDDDTVAVGGGADSSPGDKSDGVAPNAAGAVEVEVADDAPGGDVEDPEPSPWKGGGSEVGADPIHNNPGNPGDTNMDPEPSPWNPGDSHGKAISNNNSIRAAK